MITTMSSFFERLGGWPWAAVGAGAAAVPTGGGMGGGGLSNFARFRFRETRGVSDGW